MLLGLLLAVIALPVSHEEGQEAQKSAERSADIQEADKTELEAKLESLLEDVEGVGKVRVILMTGADEDAQEFYSSREKKVTGVLIAAQGGDNPVAVQNIQQGVMALFQIEAHKIKVMKMK